MIGALNETITAIASPTAPSERGILRLSGPQSLNAIVALLSHSLSEDPSKSFVRSVRLNIFGSTRSIPATLYYWQECHGFTAERALEVHTVGNEPILTKLLQKVCQFEGVRLAHPGEFTLRAFLHGRFDLTQAEALLGVINATEKKSLQTALTQLAGNLTVPLRNLRDFLLNLLSDWEAGLDFADEDISFVSSEEFQKRILFARDLLRGIRQKMNSRSRAENQRLVVLYGPPNTGKSTLYNQLKNIYGTRVTPDAIVSSQLGTTRDWLETPIKIHQQIMTLVDTAGVNFDQNQSSIDSVAIRLSEEMRERTDLILYMVPTNDASFQLQKMSSLSGYDHKIILVRSKCDLEQPLSIDRGSHPFFAEVDISVHNGSGLNDLSEAIYRFFQKKESSQVVPSTAQRCLSVIDDADSALARALTVFSLDEILVATEIRTALDAIGQMTGAIATDDLLDRIFSRFCLGK